VPEIRHDLFKQRGNFRNFGHVRFDCDGAAVLSLNLRDNVVGSDCVACIVYDNVGTATGKFEGNSCSYPAVQCISVSMIVNIDHWV
jgi:hypothetical protein